MHERVHQGPRVIAVGRMYDQSGRLVDDDHVAVLIHDVQRNILWEDLQLFRFRNLDGDSIAVLDFEFLLIAKISIDRHVAALDKLLHVTPGDIFEARGKDYVQPLSRHFAIHFYIDCIHGVSLFLHSAPALCLRYGVVLRFS